MPSIALLINPDSGQGDAERVGDLLGASGSDVRRFPVAEWREASRSGADRLVVAGGDGSIACAAAGASEAGIPLAVVATGTANDFRSGLGLPADLAEACSLAAEGERTRPMELGRAGGRPFVNVASVGLAPTAAENAHDLKSRIGALAYPLGAMKAGFTARPVTCRVDCDGNQVHDGEAWQVSVASTGAFGGGSTLDADASDGRLDLVVIEAGSRLRLIQRAYGMRLGRVEDQRGVIAARCSSVELRLEPGQCLNVDGELIDAAELTEAGTIHFTVTDDAFDLVVG